MNYYIIIPLWFALFMDGKPAENVPDRFNYAATIGGRCVTSSNAVNYYSFDTLINTGYQLKLERLPIDSFPQEILNIGQ